MKNSMQHRSRFSNSTPSPSLGVFVELKRLRDGAQSDGYQHVKTIHKGATHDNDLDNDLNLVEDEDLIDEPLKDVTVLDKVARHVKTFHDRTVPDFDLPDEDVLEGTGHSCRLKEGILLNKDLRDRAEPSRTLRNIARWDGAIRNRILGKKTQTDGAINYEAIYPRTPPLKTHHDRVLRDQGLPRLVDHSRCSSRLSVKTNSPLWNQPLSLTFHDLLRLVPVPISSPVLDFTPPVTPQSVDCRSSDQLDSSSVHSELSLDDNNLVGRTARRRLNQSRMV